MPRRHIAALSVITAALVGCASSAVATPPDAQAVLDAAIEAAGGRDAFNELGILRIQVSEEETNAKGERRSRAVVSYVDAADPGRARLEINRNVVLGMNGGVGWATMNGQVDRRPNTPRMARGTINQRTLPALLPFSLESSGVHPGEVSEATFDGKPVTALTVAFSEQHFASPQMVTDWKVFFDPKSGAIVGAEFLPEPKFADAGSEGMKFEILGWQELDGVKLPRHLVVVGVDENGIETGHTRTVKVTAERYAEGSPAALFLDPDTRDALDEGSIPGLE